MISWRERIISKPVTRPETRRRAGGQNFLLVGREGLERLGISSEYCMRYQRNLLRAQIFGVVQRIAKQLFGVLLDTAIEDDVVESSVLAYWPSNGPGSVSVFG